MYNRRVKNCPKKSVASITKEIADWRQFINTSSSDIRRLSAVQRYSSIPIAVTENTAEHSFWVALYAVMIHARVYPTNKHDHLTAVIAVKALLHDAADSVAGDVVRVFKYSSPEFKKAVHEAEDVMFQRLPKEIRLLTARLIANRLKLTKDETMYVDTIIKAADFLSLFQYMRREALRQNLEIEPFYRRMTRDISDMANTIEPILSFDASQFYQALYAASSAVYSACLTNVNGHEIGWCEVL